MNHSNNSNDSLLPELSALQHEPAPRPLPLFLELVRLTAQHEPELARAALDGLRSYATAVRPAPSEPRAEIARVGPARLRDHGGTGPPAVLIPSLINPPHILDLDPEASLAGAVAEMGRRVFLLDWGDAGQRQDLSVSGHVQELLLPLLGRVGEPPALIGYCLGGTMAIAAANLATVERVVTLAAPWRFTAYPADGRASLQAMWRDSQPTARALGALPMEVLQAAFWSLDPQRTVAKFAQFAALGPLSPQARRFIQLEDWANQGEALPCAAAEELIEDLFGNDVSGNEEWRIAGQAITDALSVPALHFTAARDRIAPAATAPSGEKLQMPSGHVGMIVGSAREQLHAGLRSFLDPACR
jgi:polyhydroxyalkanoate synthase